MKRFIPDTSVVVYYIIIFFLGIWFFPGCAPYHLPGALSRIPSSFPIGYSERGIASWYGPGFHGRLTADGEYYNMYAYTAAHRYLPFNTLVRVVNLENHKSVIVRINDRGPFVKDRIIDLSFAAARKIGMLGKGTAPVRLEVVGRASGRRSLYGRARYFVQIGAFSSRENAIHSYFYLKRKGYKRCRIVRVMQGKRYIWKVQVGEFSSLKEAEFVLSLLARKFPLSFVIAR